MKFIKEWSDIYQTEVFVPIEENEFFDEDEYYDISDIIKSKEMK